MQQGGVVEGVEALTSKAREIVLGKPATENPNPVASQFSSDDPLPATHSDPDLSNNETIIPPAAATQASTPLLF
jgi:hypothetical protein